MNIPLRTPSSMLFIASALIVLIAALQQYGVIAIPQLAPYTTLAALAAWVLLALGCTQLTQS